MEIYVLTQTNVDVDSGDFETQVLCVSADFGKPQHILEERQKGLRKFFNERYDYEESNYCEGDMSWEIWQKEFYASNHVSLQITQETLE